MKRDNRRGKGAQLVLHMIDFLMCIVTQISYLPRVTAVDDDYSKAVRAQIRSMGVWVPCRCELIAVMIHKVIEDDTDYDTLKLPRIPRGTVHSGCAIRKFEFEFEFEFNSNAITCLP